MGGVFSKRPLPIYPKRIGNVGIELDLGFGTDLVSVGVDQVNIPGDPVSANRDVILAQIDASLARRDDRRGPFIDRLDADSF